MSKLAIPITETPNELTLDIDVADAVGKLRILRQADAQVFTGWRDLPGALEAVAVLLRDLTACDCLQQCTMMKSLPH